MQSFYSIPVSSRTLVKKQRLKTCDLETAVKQYLYLILSTEPGECWHDTSLGCRVYNYEYQAFSGSEGASWEGVDEVLGQLIKEDLENNIPAFGPFELLIEKVKVTVDDLEVHQLPKVLDPDSPKMHRFLRRLAIEVNSIVSKTGQQFSHLFHICINPI